MSMWSENPDWFDEWLEQQAMNGRFGDSLQKSAEAGGFCGWEWWDKLDKDGSLGQEAMTAYIERLIP